MSAFNSQHQLVGRESLKRGRFSFLVPPGWYTLAIYNYKRSVEAKANATVHANIVFQEK